MAMMDDLDLTALVEATAEGIVDSRSLLLGGPCWAVMSADHKAQMRERALPFVHMTALTLAGMGYAKREPGDWS